MSQDHPPFQLDIPDLATGRLHGEPRRRLEEHLRGCESCVRLLETARMIASVRSADEDGPSSPHPGIQELRDHALLVAPLAPEGQRHVEQCDRCSLEVHSWTNLRLPASGTVKVGRWSPAEGRRWALAAASLAAGLILVTAGWSLRSLVPERKWSGSLRAISLQEPTRGAAVLPVLTIRRGDAYALLEVRLDLYDTPRKISPFEFRLAPLDGRTVWSLKIPVAEVETTLEESRTFNLAIPTDVLKKAIYELVVLREDRPSDPPLLQVRFEVREEIE